MKKTAPPSATDSPSVTQQSLLQKVGTLLAQRRPQEALDIVEDGLNRLPASAELYNIAGVCAVNTGDFGKAERYWLKAITINPDAVEAHHNLGKLNTQINRFDTAEQYYRKAITLSPEDATIYSNLGTLLANSSRLEEAEQCYRKAIGLNPGNTTVYSDLGELLANINHHKESEQCYRMAIALDHNDVRALTNLGNLLASSGKHEEAEQCYRQAIMHDPNNATTYSNLGLLLSNLKRYDDAEQCYRTLVDLAPGHAMANFNLGAILANRNQDDEAERYFRKAIGLDPDNAMICFTLSILLEKQNKYDEAERCYREVIALDPGNIAALSNLGSVLARGERYEEAEQCYRKAINLNPGFAIAYSNLGALLASLNRPAEAEQCYRQAIVLDPGNVKTFINMGNLLFFCGERYNEAEQCYRQAIALDSSNTTTQYRLGQVLLAQGRFEEGWRCYEFRYSDDLPKQIKVAHHIRASFPQWQGEPLTGKSLLIWPEQGLGDEIQFCRYLQLLKERGASSITLVCKQSLKPLLETLAGVDTVIGFDESDAVIPAHDYWTYLLSVPLHCKTTLETIPARIPYLRTLPERVAKWSARLPRDGFRVGLAWKGNSDYLNDKYRSLANLTILAPLWTIPGIQFVSLQMGSGQEEARHAPAGQPLLDLSHEIADFADTAAIIEQLDLVICVDTAVAHLAGALAKPCWVMLPGFGRDWRWLRERNDSPWYPDVMRLFRQTNDDDWTATVLDIKNALCDELTLRHHRN